MDETTTTNVHEVIAALERDCVVLADWTGRRVTINGISKAADGHYVVSWSHRTYHNVQVSDLNGDETFIIRPPGAPHR
jgi:hypothetical protein